MVSRFLTTGSGTSSNIRPSRTISEIDVPRRPNILVIYDKVLEMESLFLNASRRYTFHGLVFLTVESATGDLRFLTSRSIAASIPTSV